MNVSYLSKNLQYLRKERGISQQALGKALGLSRSNIASYENNKAEPRVLSLAAIARFFNISLNQLIDVDLQALPGTQILPANNNIRKDLTNFLEKRVQIIDEFKQKTAHLKIIIEGFRAFHELKMSKFGTDIPSDVQAMARDYENLLSVVESLTESNVNLVEHFNKII